MKLYQEGAKQIEGAIIFFENQLNCGFDEVVDVVSGEIRQRGRVLSVNNDVAAIQIFGSSESISLESTRVSYLNKPFEIPLSEGILGKIFNGLGETIDGQGDILTDIYRDVNGSSINPFAREYPKNFIQTGISTIDIMNTLIRGQKLPIFSGNGLPHDRLAAQIVRQAAITNEDEKFIIVFGAMGVKYDVAQFFINSFEEAGVTSHVVLYLSLANAPSVERLLTPRSALTAAEYLAFELGYQVLVILTDMTNYCEALREVSSVRGEVPSRKGYPGYLYSDLASLYERCGRIKNLPGSITQIPILTMPNDDITHPIPDLTGYITEGQIVLDRGLHQQGIYPPIGVLQSLSRLMKDGIGKGKTREDHPSVASQLFAMYSKVLELRELVSIIGEEELNDLDKLYLAFGKKFENQFVIHEADENRSLENSLTLGWELLSDFGEEELYRISKEFIAKYKVSK